MKKILFSECWLDINCLLPIYDNTGANCTRIMFKDRENFIDPRTIKTAVKNLAKYFAVDLESVKWVYGSYVNRKTSMPIPLHPEMILVPIKFRKPLLMEHGAWGYLVLNKISGYKSCTEHNKTQITFNNGQNITVLLNTTKVKSILNDAQILKTVYVNRLNIRDDTLKEDCSYHDSYHVKC
jgi:competence transcription factor ComK